MISLEHIRQLQDKVNKAVYHLGNLQAEKDLLAEENDLLRGKIHSYETRITELEAFIEEFKSEQSEIEMGIISALKHLDTLEEAVDELKTEPLTREIEADHTSETVVAPEPGAELPPPAVTDTEEEPGTDDALVENTDEQAFVADPEESPQESVEDDESGQLDIF